LERSWSRSHVIKNTAPEPKPEPCLRKQRPPVPEPDPLHFYKSSAALLLGLLPLDLPQKKSVVDRGAARIFLRGGLKLWKQKP